MLEVVGGDRQARVCRIVAWAALMLCVSSAGALADYVLGPGDRVAVSFFGAGEMRHETMVDIDGGITVPVAGRLSVAGLTLAQVQDRIGTTVAARPFRKIGSSGEELWFELQPADVLVEIADYAPVYASGHVASPGQIAFTPGMTARQLIARAGGVRALQLGPQEAQRMMVDLAAERSIVAASLATKLARVNRIRAELATLDRESGASGPERDAPASKALDGVGQEIVDAGDTLRRSKDTTAGELLVDMQQRLGTLHQRQERENSLIELYTDEVARAENLEERGLATSRVRTDAASSMLLAGARSLDTSDEIARLEIEMARLDAERGRAPTEDRRQFLEELEAQLAEADVARAELGAMEERLLAIAGLPLDGDGSEGLVLTLHRKSGEEVVARQASVDETLLPGDVVVIAVRDVSARQ